jgi:hypothetical protein
VCGHVWLLLGHNMTLPVPPVLQITGAVYWDAVGSIAVSALLGVVAITLIQRNRKWLIGKSMPKVSSAGHIMHTQVHQ